MLTFAHWMSYRDLTAALICLLLAVKSTMNTKVLLSSIFFIADSVVNGYLMTRYLSITFALACDFLVYRGFLGNASVFGW